MTLQLDLTPEQKKVIEGLSVAEFRVLQSLVLVALNPKPEAKPDRNPVIRITLDLESVIAEMRARAPEMIRRAARDRKLEERIMASAYGISCDHQSLTYDECYAMAEQEFLSGKLDEAERAGRRRRDAPEHVQARQELDGLSAREGDGGEVDDEGVSVLRDKVTRYRTMLK